MAYKKILTIQDISCVGQCSMTVALPIVSACGHETCIIPSAVLSTHTGNFTGFTVRDLTEDIPGIHKHWQKENIAFDAIYTGYLGSTKQVSYVIDIFDTMLAPEGKIIVDPAMADNGKLYYGFDDAYVEAMRELCSKADIVLPNITEGCFLAGLEYQESYDEAYVLRLLEKLVSMGAGCVVLTGVGYDAQSTGVVVYENGAMRYYKHARISKSYHGTGDVYSSAFVGSLMQGKEILEAASIAADFTVEAIRNTLDDAAHWYGVKFETALPGLIKRLH